MRISVIEDLYCPYNHMVWSCLTDLQGDDIVARQLELILVGRVTSLLVPDHRPSQGRERVFLSEAQIIQLSLGSSCGSPETRRDHLTLKTGCKK